MTHNLKPLPSRAARSTAAAAAALVLGLSLPLSLMAQDPVPEESATDAAPEGTPAADAQPAEATDGQALPQTIPVPEEPAAVDGGAPAYPYTYAALRLTRIEYDESETDGFGLEGSYLLMPNIFAIAAYSGGSSDDTASTDSSQYEFGAGYREMLTPFVDFNASVRLLTTDTESTADSSLDLGYRFDAGVRGRLTPVLPRLEASAALSYVEGQQHHHGFLVGSALYELRPRLSLGAEAVAGKSSTSYGLLGRWAF